MPDAQKGPLNQGKGNMHGYGFLMTEFSLQDVGQGMYEVLTS